MNARPGMYGAGQAAEQEAARRLAKNGWVVIPISEYTNNTGTKINAPMLVIPDGVAISPDLLAIKPDKQIWFEVKDKTEPTYTWKFHRWEHGIDKPNIDSYRIIQEKTGVRVVILIHEKSSPKTSNLNLRIMDGISARLKMKADLQPSDTWLYINLDNAIRYGNERGGNREMVKQSNPMGLGLYWPRMIMKEWME